MNLNTDSAAVAAGLAGIVIALPVFADAFDTLTGCFPGGRNGRNGRNAVGRHSRLEAMQRQLAEGDARLSAMRANTAAAEDAFRIAQEARQRAEERLAIMEEHLRQNRPELHSFKNTRGTADGEFRSTEPDRWSAEQKKRRAEDDVRQAAEERSRAIIEAGRARQEQDDAYRALRDAEATASVARVGQEEAEDKLRKGIRPVIEPTQAEFRAARERLQYEEGMFHFAIAGIAGSGKTSLVNAFRGLRNSDKAAAPTGIIETTSAIARYPDPEYPFAWYDVPGAGTLSVPDWQYFTDQGLYALDCIIVLLDIRLTSTDIAILRDCARFDIPAYIVRSKATQHTRNLAGDMPDADDDDDDDAGILERAREMYIQETRASVARNLKAAGLPEQRVYMVDKDTLARKVKGRSVRDGIDEEELLHDLLAEAHRRNARADT